MKMRFNRHWALVMAMQLIGFAFSTNHAFARKTNQAVYEEPFDQAAGGSSLTRASQEGVMFANPALMPHGQKFFRWFGSEISLIAAKQSIDQVQNLTTGSEEEVDEGEEGDDERSSFFTDAFTTPIHFGAAATVSFISSNFGLGTFARFEPDIAGKKHDETGVPELRARAEVYGGAVSSVSQKVNKWLSVGLTGKYLYKTEPDIVISLSDQEKINELMSDPQALRDENEIGQGLGADVGALLFFQGQTTDYRVALKVDDVGDTSFNKEQDPFLQTYSAGLGLTFHNSIDSIHLSLDFRDIAGAYEEPIAMRAYAGAKLILRNFLGLAVGLYQGYPTWGIRLDLFFVKAGLTFYGREFGTFAGEDPRNIYVAYFGVGV